MSKSAIIACDTEEAERKQKEGVYGGSTSWEAQRPVIHAICIGCKQKGRFIKRDQIEKIKAGDAQIHVDKFGNFICDQCAQWYLV